MKVGFYAQVFESLGVEYLSACLKEAGHETRVFLDPKLGNDAVIQNMRLARLFNIEDMLVEEMLEEGIDIAAFSVTTDAYGTALQVARKLKARADITTVFGGIHVTSVPHRVIQQDAVDYAVIGEAEYAFVDLVNVLSSGEREFQIPNVLYLHEGEVKSTPVRPLIDDLDTLPFPDKDLYLREAKGFRKANYAIMASRGCPYSCTYCNNPVLKGLYEGRGHWNRRRSVDNVIAELRWAVGRYRFNRVAFWDENFVDDLDWLEEFTQNYADAVHLPFYAWASPKLVSTDVVGLLEKAGCQDLSIGVQTVYETTRRKYLRRYETNDDITSAFDAVRRSRIFLCASNILQLPGQTLEEVVDMVRFYNENRVDMAYVHFLRYLPGTEITRIAHDEGILSDEEVEHIEQAEEVDACCLAGPGDDPIYAKLRVLIMLSCALPKSFIRALLRKERYRHLPRLTAPTVITHVIILWRRLTAGKRRFQENYTLLDYLRTWCYVTFAKLRWKRRLRTRSAGANPRCRETEN